MMVMMVSATVVLILLLGLVELAQKYIRARNERLEARAELAQARLDLLKATEEADRRTAELAAQLEQATVKPPPSKTCGSCYHWELAGGQAALRQNAAFLAASGVLAPHQMGRTVQYDLSGQVIPRRDGKTGLMSSTWAEMGACHLRNEGTFQKFTCPNYHAEDAPVPEGGFGPPTPFPEPDPAPPTVPTSVIVQRMEADIALAHPKPVARETPTEHPQPCEQCGEPEAKLRPSDHGHVNEWLCKACSTQQAAGL